MGRKHHDENAGVVRNRFRVQDIREETGLQGFSRRHRRNLIVREGFPLAQRSHKHFDTEPDQIKGTGGLQGSVERRKARNDDAEADG
jgi:hypothetical protein